jgi:retinol-binding protein 3
VIRRRWNTLHTFSLAVAVAFALGTGTRSVRAADAPPPRPDLEINASTRAEVIEGVARLVETRYVFPDVANRIASSLRSRAAKSRYGSLTSATALCESLTSELRAISKDRHLKVDYYVRARPMPKSGPDEAPTPEQQAARRADFAYENNGFRKVERLPGNVGYLRLDRFADPELAGETARAAMSFLSNTDALIIDLRKNGGGTPLMVALLASYLLEPEPVHLNSIYSRVEDQTKQIWSFAYLPGPRYTGRDVFVLTSAWTFSGAEEFAYDLKSLKRAVIVGERTRGGAHPGGIEQINEHFAIMLPTARAINPVTNTNWEGVGVEPDLAAPADSALVVAHRTALTKLIVKTKDPDRAEEYREALSLVGK